MRWFVTTCQWSPLASDSNAADVCGGAFKRLHTRQVSYYELAIALEAVTRIVLGGPTADLATKAALVQLGFRALARNRSMRNSSDAVVSFARAFEPRISRVAIDLCGLWLPGLMRRPLWHHREGLTNFIALNIAWARGSMDTAHCSLDAKKQSKMFGVGFHIKLGHYRTPPTWYPAQFAAAHLAFDETQALADGHDVHPNVRGRTQCFFGHVTNKLHPQRFLPTWRGATFDSRLCLTFRNIAKREVDSPGIDILWLATAPPPEPIAPRAGTCYRGHRTSSAQGYSGKQAWQAMPTEGRWKEVPPGATLCQRCYLLAWRQGTKASSSTTSTSVVS